VPSFALYMQWKIKCVLRICSEYVLQKMEVYVKILLRLYAKFILYADGTCMVVEIAVVL